jgi:hypothetical protein
LTARLDFDIPDKIPYPNLSNHAFKVEHLGAWQAAFPYSWATDAAWAVGTGWYGHKEAHLTIRPVRDGRRVMPSGACFVRAEFTAEMIQADVFAFPSTALRNLIPDYLAGVWLERNGYDPVRHHEHWYDSVSFVLELE